MNTEPEIAVWAITPAGSRLASKLVKNLERACLFLSENIDDKPGAVTFRRLSTAVSEYFHQFRGHVFLMSAGIVVRVIAAHIREKTEDPGVVVVDDAGRFAISLLSGHLGGANELARSVAKQTGGIPVITTATDVNNLPSADLIAKEQNLVIENPGAIKTVNMAFLRNEKVLLHDPYNLLRGMIPESFLEKPDSEKLEPGNNENLAIVVDDRVTEHSHNSILLRPKSLSAGIGCNRGTPLEEIEELLAEVCKKNKLSVLSIQNLASAELKKDETGILELGRKLGVPIRFYDSKTLDNVESVKNPSNYVKKCTGAKSVCEAAAILAANTGSLIVTKKKTRNVTIAIAREKTFCTS